MVNDQYELEAMALDDDNVYFANGAGMVFEVSKSGGPTKMLLSNLGQFRAGWRPLAQAASRAARLKASEPTAGWRARKGPGESARQRGCLCGRSHRRASEPPSLGQTFIGVTSGQSAFTPDGGPATQDWRPLASSSMATRSPLVAS